MNGLEVIEMNITKHTKKYRNNSKYFRKSMQKRDINLKSCREWWIILRKLQKFYSKKKKQQRMDRINWILKSINSKMIWLIRNSNSLKKTNKLNNCKEKKTSCKKKLRSWKILINCSNSSNKFNLLFSKIITHYSITQICSQINLYSKSPKYSLAILRNKMIKCSLAITNGKIHKCSQVILHSKSNKYSLVIHRNKTHQ